MSDTITPGPDPETITEELERLRAEVAHLRGKGRESDAFREAWDLHRATKAEVDRLRAGIEKLADQWDINAADHYAQSERGSDAMTITAQGCIAGTYATAARSLRALLHVDIESEAGA